MKQKTKKQIKKVSSTTIKFRQCCIVQNGQNFTSKSFQIMYNTTITATKETFVEHSIK